MIYNRINVANRDLNIDPLTGEKLFHPKLLTNQKHYHDPSTVFQELYEDKNRKDLIVKNLLEKENTILMINSYKPLEISKKIVIMKRRFALQEIFELFDSDKDGEISSENIDISKIQSKKLIILAPFLYYIEKNERKLKVEEFIVESEKFCKGLSYQDLHVLFD